MDVAKLKAKLSTARLMLGDVAETIPQLGAIPPIGFAAFDLDYYSSTKRALSVFNAPHLSRVFCYFDDIMSEIGCHNECIGELFAIRELNAEQPNQKLCPLNGLEWMLAHQAGWRKRIYVLHDFGHPLYSAKVIGKSEAHKLRL